MIKFAVAIPCFNEGENIPILVEKISHLSQKSNIFF